jgi:hypothetical protein
VRVLAVGERRVSAALRGEAAFRCEADRLRRREAGRAPRGVRLRCANALAVGRGVAARTAPVIPNGVRDLRGSLVSERLDIPRCVRNDTSTTVLLRRAAPKDLARGNEVLRCAQEDSNTSAALTSPDSRTRFHYHRNPAVLSSTVSRPPRLSASSAQIRVLLFGPRDPRCSAHQTLKTRTAADCADRRCDGVAGQRQAEQRVHALQASRARP